MKIILILLLLASTAHAADCPTKPGKYELVQTCDTVLCPVGSDDDGRILYGFRVDTTYGWRPIQEGIADTCRWDEWGYPWDFQVAPCLSDSIITQPFTSEGER